jgi:hypothetical protein
LEAINTVLEVLRTKREYGVNGGAGATTVDQDKDVVDTLGQPLTSEDEVENVLRPLVHIATKEFGFAPSDVCEAIFSPANIRKQHADAIQKLKYSNLATLVSQFSDYRSLTDVSHCVVALHPIESEDGDDDWEVDYKSDRIAEKVMGQMKQQEVKLLQENCNTFHRCAEGSTLAEWVLEAIVNPNFLTTSVRSRHSTAPPNGRGRQ